MQALGEAASAPPRVEACSPESGEGTQSMQIDERKVGDVIILDLKGKMTLGDGDELLRSKINSLVQAGPEEASC